MGAVGQVEWRNLGGHSFSGIFTGATKGVVRFSLAKEPLPPALNTAPGMGLKFLRDGVDSANLVAMYGVDGHHEDIHGRATTNRDVELLIQAFNMCGTKYLLARNTGNM